jgi:hypothetical protein
MEAKLRLLLRVDIVSDRETILRTRKHQPSKVAVIVRGDGSGRIYVTAAGLI